MNRHTRQVPLLVAAVVTMVLALPWGAADAASKKKATKAPPATEAAYRCRDANGHHVMGQSIPPDCMDRDVEVLDVSGRVVRIIPGRDSLAAAAAAKAAEDARIAAAQRDKTLIATYLSVADIERLRDERLATIDAQRTAAEQYVENLHSRLGLLQSRALLFKPYNPRAEARRMPDDLAEDLVRTLNEMKTQNNALAAKDDEQSAMRKQFQADIERYKQLRTVRTSR